LINVSGAAVHIDAGGTTVLVPTRAINSALPKHQLQALLNQGCKRNAAPLGLVPGSLQ